MKKHGRLILAMILIFNLLLLQGAFAKPATTPPDGGTGGNTPGTAQPKPGEQAKPQPEQGKKPSKDNAGKQGGRTNKKSKTGKSVEKRAINDEGQYRQSYDVEKIVKKKEDKNKGKLSIIFSGDMHSHLLSVNDVGGFAKLNTQIKEIKESYPDSLVLDAGDFSMGTPFQTIFMSDASELRMLGYLDYDATTLGNHEFDYKPTGLARMFNKAAESKKVTTIAKVSYDKKTGMKQREVISNQYMPEVVSSNIDWKATLSDKKLAPDAKKLKKAMSDYGVRDYTVIHKGDAKVAVFGLMGEEAIADAPKSGVKWTNYIERAKEIVNEIKRNKEADYIVCLSHSGYYKEKGKDSEDVQLAKEVPDIDVIISGHSHEALNEPIKQGKTVIASSGEYTNCVGHMVFEITKSGLKQEDYKLHSLDKNVKEDPATNSKIRAFSYDIDGKYFSIFGFSMNRNLAKSSFDFESMQSFVENHSDSNLGNIISDSYIYAVKKAEGKKYEDVTCSVVPSGVVRGTFKKGDITVGDAFNVSSLGIGPDNIPGYPLVSVYLTGKELKTLAEVDASISPRMPAATIHMSGIKYKTNNHRLILNRATDIKRIKKDGSEENLDNKKLYRVVGGLYSCQMLGVVTEKSKGLLSIKPKDKNGKEIADFEKHIIKKNGRELKEWYALASYIDSFKDGKVPKVYEKAQARKTANNSYAPWEIVKQPNNYGVMLIAVILIPIVIIIGFIIFLSKRRKRRRGYNTSMFGAKRKKRRPLLKSNRMGLKRKRRKF